MLSFTLRFHLADSQAPGSSMKYLKLLYQRMNIDIVNSIVIWAVMKRWTSERLFEGSKNVTADHQLLNMMRIAIIFLNDCLCLPPRTPLFGEFESRYVPPPVGGANDRLEENRSSLLRYSKKCRNSPIKLMLSKFTPPSFEIHSLDPFS